jgi:site-specific DNA-methyltransferase (cytosine-N4-specific)
MNEVAIPSWRVLVGDAREKLAELGDGSAQMCVTSPAYWQKRDYGRDGQLGMEATPEGYVDALVDVLGGVHRVLQDDGSLWLNIGDSYAAGGNGGGGSLARKRRNWRSIVGRRGWRSAPEGYKSKDLTLAPFQVADALREWGWYLRQCIVWWRMVANEPNRMDRPAVSHEYLFLLSKSEDSSVRNPGESWWSQSVWSIPAAVGSDGHPAPMPEELARRCIVAGSRPGGLVVDPFNGSGTSGVVAVTLGRSYVGIDLNGGYVESSRRRIGNAAPLFAIEAEEARLTL